VTSPDERFDDAFGDERISRGIWQEMPQEPFVLPSSSFPPGDNIRAALRYIEDKYGPIIQGYMAYYAEARCAHCNLRSTVPFSHVCDTAVQDWIWAIPETERRMSRFDAEAMSIRLYLVQATSLFDQETN
jgi:hypothetical protein